MATTTNYGWTTPDDTALVKDGAAAIRTLGSSVDTTTKNLNPETTLGDIAYRSSTANVKTRLAIGSTGNVLTVAGGVPTWAAPAGGSAMILTGQSTFSASNSVSVDNCFSATYVNYIIALTAIATNSSDGIYLRFRTGGSTNTTGNYNVQQFGADGANLSASRQTSQTEGRVGDINTGGDNLNGFVANPYQTDYTTFMATGILNPSSTLGRKDYYNNFAATTSFDGINFWCSVGTITGNVKIYGLVNS